MSDQSNKSINWISFRVKPSEHEIIFKLFAKSAHRKFSEYARKVLLQEPVVIHYRNESADAFLQAMLEIKKELNAIGHNYNQVVKKLHTLQHEKEVRQWLLEQQPIQQQLTEKTEQLFITVQKIYSQWLSV